jgi:DNA replication and repair protein RecF
VTLDAARDGVAVVRLMLEEFRSYRALRLEVDPRPVVLTGANGAGKTNILEALSFLAPGRGLRRARLDEVARRDGGAGVPWAVAARLEQSAGGLDIGPLDIGTGREAGSERRTVRINGEAAKSQAVLAEVVSLVWLTPSMDRLFSEGASGRRRFLDRLVMGLDPAHARRALAYEHAMRERARLLGDEDGGRGDAAWLATLEERMAQEGVAIASARLAWAKRLDAACRERVGPFPAAALMVDGVIEGWLATQSEDEVRARFAKALADARPRDAAAGVTTLGPHRSDLLLRHADRDLPAEQGSTGEQKAVLVRVLLAQARVQRAERGQAPMLLLDEVVAHLDEERRAALFDELAALSGQSWLTGTDAALFAPFGDRAQMFRLEAGTLHPV